MDKDAIRETVWDALEESGVARFPFPPQGRIPNFAGADAAARRLATLPFWEGVEVLKCNPDAPQRPVRERALSEGCTLVMARPRLAEERPFLVIDPDSVNDPADAATIGGAEDYGEPVGIDAVPPIDAIVSGSVAVDEAGRRIGKGEGYSDLEFAVLLETGAIDREVTIATTIHPIQLRSGALPQDETDVALDIVVTSETSLRSANRPTRPTGVDWSALPTARMAEMPAIQRLAPAE